ncbi:MAG: ABC transporter ATP-binding protein [Promicromonosporaceae bacterium]|nr:ABC transporter ATP-binding protein [Promicromonosporaceae bacterium]
MSAIPVIAAHEVSKAYATGGVDMTVLQPTSLTIDPAEQVVIVGPSGSGKSTLLTILGTLETPSTGRVLVQGREVTALREWERSAVRAQSIGFVFQQFHLMPTLTAVGNVATGLLYSGVSHSERNRRAVAALESVGLGHRLGHRPKMMSGGEQQRVAIARALIRKPAVLFADEPTGALDSATGEMVIDLLAQVADRGTAVVIVTHDHAIAAKFDRRIQILDGHATQEVGHHG